MGREGTTRCSQLTLVFAALGEGLRDNSSLDLAGGGLGQLVDKVHLGGDFEGGKVLLQEGNQFFIGHLLVLLQDDGSLDHLTVHVVGDTKGHGFVDFRVRQHDTIQLNGRNLFTTPVDKFFDSTRENQEALRVEIALVAGPEVVFLLGKVLLVGLWVVGVASVTFSPLMETSPTLPGGKTLSLSSRIRTVTPCGWPTVPGFLFPGGRLFEVIWCDASVIA